MEAATTRRETVPRSPAVGRVQCGRMNPCRTTTTPTRFPGHPRRDSSPGRGSRAPPTTARMRSPAARVASVRAHRPPRRGHVVDPTCCRPSSSPAAPAVDDRWTRAPSTPAGGPSVRTPRVRTPHARTPHAPTPSARPRTAEPRSDRAGRCPTGPRTTIAATATTAGRGTTAATAMTAEQQRIAEQPRTGGPPPIDGTVARRPAAPGSRTGHRIQLAPRRCGAGTSRATQSPTSPRRYRGRRECRGS